MDRAMRDGRLAGLRGAARGGVARAAGSWAGAWPIMSSPRSARRSERARDHRAARPRGRCRHRHPAERPGARDQLRPGRLRPACRAGRDGQHHHGRHRHRHASAAARIPGRSMRHAGDGDVARRHRAHRQGAAHRRHRCSETAPEADVDASPTGASAAPRSNRSFDFFELAREAARITLPAGSRRTGSPSPPTTRCTIRSFPTAAPSARSRSIPRPARVEITRYASVDDVGRCINPLIVHGQTHGAIAQGVGQAMWEQCALDPASGQPLVRLAHGLRHAAGGCPAVASAPRSSRCCRRPIRSASRPAARAARRRRSAVIVSAILDALAPLGVRDDRRCRRRPSPCGRRSATPRPRRTRRADRRALRDACHRSGACGFGAWRSAGASR